MNILRKFDKNISFKFKDTFFVLKNSKNVLGSNFLLFSFNPIHDGPFPSYSQMGGQKYPPPSLNLSYISYDD